MDKNRRIWVFAITGDVMTEFLLTSDLSLPEPAQEIIDVARTVLVDRTDAVLGNLIFHGRLRLRWIYAGRPTLPGSAQSVLSSAAETPYAVRVSAAKATSEMECKVSKAYVQDGKTEIVRRHSDGSIAGIRDHSIIVLSAHFGNHQEFAVPATDDVVAPRWPLQRPVISHFRSRRR